MTQILSSRVQAFFAQANQAVEHFDFGPLINVGGIGVVLAWLLWKSEPRMRGIEAAIDRLTRMIAVFLIELPHVIDAVKLQAREAQADCDRAAAERGEKKA